MKKYQIRKILFLGLGILALVIGIVGIFLPILPTTPLFLLALYAFTNSSERVTKWFKSSKLYKKHLEDYKNKKALTIRQKLTILLTVGIVMLIPCIITNNLHVKIAMSIVFLFHVYLFVFRIKTYRPETQFQRKELEEEI
jgi:uncharacterized membrane protein YbaN (DUF454 family)